ncbi:MAG: hypothetical protein GXP49_14495 [Deltaproteobacteria bacterium]|nr:hypothetical protein [Deltaproteobacteria bacterium]
MKPGAYLVIGLAAFVLTGAGDSSLVLSPRPRGVKFDHSAHMKNSNPGCAFCHKRVLDSRRVTDDLRPEMSTCAACHKGLPREGEDIRPRDADCLSCHVHAGVVPPGPLAAPAARIHFNHAEHLARTRHCEQCHQVAGVRVELPKMSNCLSCHDGQRANKRCSLCHLSDEFGRLVTGFPQGKLIPGRNMGLLEHDTGWIRAHGGPARLFISKCESCHDQDYCLSCHAGVLKPGGIHPGNWETMHPIAARGRSAECNACHRNEGSCKACHDRLGASLASPYRSNNYRIHPRNWARTDGTKPGHARAASRNPESCVSCHTEKDCIKCHGSWEAGFGGIKPHGHLSRSELLRRYRRNSRPCKACHPGGIPGGGL